VTFHEGPVPGACMGAYSTQTALNATERCALGYEGRLCGNCAAGWGRVASGCTRCTGGGSIILSRLVLVGILFLFTGFMAFVIRGAITAAESGETRVQSSIIKVLLSHLQVVSLVTSTS
jgi:hypothetical protein